MCGICAQTFYTDAQQGPSGGAPPDEPKEHVELATSSRHEYAILLGGTMDGPSTRSPIGYGAWSQVFEPNKFVKMENVGDIPVVNPWIIVNGQRNWRTLEEIVKEATGPYITEKEKAIAIWVFQRAHRFHATPSDGDNLDPVKMLNVYGYTLCGDDAQVISDLWRAAGLKVRRGFPQGHCTAEAWFDNEFHLLDGDEHIICLRRDNETIASEADIVRDHDLMKRTHTYGILAADNRQTDEFSASLTLYEGHREGEHGPHLGHKMHLTLRPGEALIWRWDNIGKIHGGFEGSAGLKSWGTASQKLVCNGKMLYTPDLRKPSGHHAISDSQNLAFAESDSSKPALVAASPGRPAHATFAVRSPYVIIGGAVKLTGKGPLKTALSFDGKQWTELPQVEDGALRDTETIPLDPHIPTVGPARYSYFLKVEMTGGAGLEGISFDTDVQMAPLSLPALELGENKIVYTDETAGPHSLRITHNWVERSGAKAPGSPTAPVFPTDGAPVEGTQFTFKWQEPAESGSQKIADYHFQLSNFSDLRWPLSSNFDKLISHTASKGSPEYKIPYVGLLNPGQEYYWRVRARNDAGVWSAWSPIWRFTPQGPGVPRNLRLKVDRVARTVTLSWSPNPKGRQPARYKVYGSNEKGFSISDNEYEVLTESIQVTGARKVEKSPSNLVTETDKTQLVIAGPDLKLPNANKAHYRVVAIDEKGIESGPSDQAFVQRPFIHTLPPTSATVGQRYRYQVAATSSLGDLRCRSFSPQHSYSARFWDKDDLRFELLAAPKWLSIDAKTGLITGTPTDKDVGKTTVKVLADIPKVACDCQEYELRVNK
jgi:hypothetical protein